MGMFRLSRNKKSYPFLLLSGSNQEMVFFALRRFRLPQGALAWAKRKCKEASLRQGAHEQMSPQ